MHARPYCHHQRTMENVDKYYGNILSLDLATNERKQEHQQQQQHEKEKVLASMGRVYTHCHSRRSIVVELIVIKFVETHTHKH